MTEQELFLQELRQENAALHEVVYDLRRENAEWREKYEKELVCHISEMCECERLKAAQRIPVESLGLPDRVWHALKRAGINDLDALRQYAEKSQLAAIPGIGERGVTAIERVMEAK